MDCISILRLVILHGIHAVLQYYDISHRIDSRFCCWYNNEVETSEGFFFLEGVAGNQRNFAKAAVFFFKDKHTRAAQMVRRTQHVASLLTATRKQKKTSGESILFSLCPFSNVQKWKICAFFFFISLPLPQLGLMKLSGPFRRMVHGAIGFCEKQFSFSIPWWPVYAITLFIVQRRNSSVQQCADCLKLV